MHGQKAYRALLEWVIAPPPQDLAVQLKTDTRRGLPWRDEQDAAVRRKVFGTNKGKDRVEVSFWSLVWEALEVSKTV